jgi:hypothetical protein
MVTSWLTMARTMVPLDVDMMNKQNITYLACAEREAWQHYGAGSALAPRGSLYESSPTLSR